MAYTKCSPLTVFLFAAFLMFPAKKVEADCPIACVPGDSSSCGSSGCTCVRSDLVLGLCVSETSVGSVSKMIDAHPNLCQSNDDCINKGSGNYCARNPNSDVLYGWCVNSDAGKLLDGFLKMPTAIAQ